MSPTEPPQIPLPVPGQYQSSRTSLDHSSRQASANGSSGFRKTSSIDSIRGLSLNEQRRDSVSSIHSNTLSESSFSTRLLKVKVFHGSDIFVIALPGVCSFRELLSKIERKIQLAGTNLPENHPFRLRYKDEDGDFIQIFGDDDLILAFEVCTHLGGSNKGVMHLFVE
jgi:cell division control protein 24